MARLDQFLIAPMTDGLQTDVPSFMIPERAFAELRNAYVWRGRVRKRFGAKYIPNANSVAGYEQLQNRLRVKVGTIAGPGGTLSAVAPGYTNGTIGQMFSIGTNLYTVYQAGVAVDMLRTGGAATAYTFDTTSGTFNFAGETIGVDVYWYPALPVMGLVNYEVAAINDEPTYAFDTRMAYQYLATGWERLGTGLWTGSNSQFFWSQNYRAEASFDTALFVTNNSATDHVRYWNGTLATWATLQPAYTTTAGDTLEGCRIVISFKDRLLFLNTYERVDATGDTSNHSNRIRFCQNGSPLETDAWYQNPETIGKGGWIEADTQEAIISARILRDRLIVFFERSTWELVYTGNKILPFVFQRINSELGAESTFSTVLFDRALLGVGNVGIQACNGANVERIDNKIPQAVFSFHNGNDGVERVYGIRDYHAEMVYWTLPDQTADPIYPTRVLTYNYKDRTWGINDDSITCFGYIQNFNDETWQIATQQWQQRVDQWNAGDMQSEYRYVIAGNQQGYTFLIDEDETRNAPALQISNLTNAAGVVTVTSVDHNFNNGDLEDNDFILIENEKGTNTIDATDALGDASGFAPGTRWQAGQQFLIGTTTFTIVDDVGATAMTQSGPAATSATFDLATGEYVFVGASALANIIWLQTGVHGIYEIKTTPTTSTFTINEPDFAGVYTGGGTITRVSKIDILTKQFNFYQKQGLNLHIPKVGFYVDRTANGQISTDYFTSSSIRSTIQDGTVSGSIMGTGILETTPYDDPAIEATQKRFWHVVYPQAEGEVIQIRLFLSDEQMRDQNIALSDFQLNAISIYSRRVHRF